MAGNGEPGAAGKPGERGAPAGGGRGGRGGTGGRGGERGRRGARGPRDSRRLLLTLCVLAGVLLLVVSVMSTVTLVQQRQVAQNSATIEDVEQLAKAVVKEGVVRQDETCTLFETDYLAAVSRLRSTYAYLLQLRPEETDDAINRFVVLNLPVAEAEAVAAKAPEFCDAPRVGLREDRRNDPALPKRPRGLALLLDS